METINIIIPVITLIVGGGAGWVFTIKYTRRQAEADAMQHYQTAYQGLINDLKDDRKALREELQQLRKQLSEADNRIEILELGQRQNSSVIKQLAKLACIKASQCKDCVLIDISQL